MADVAEAKVVAVPDAHDATRTIYRITGTSLGSVQRAIKSVHFDGSLIDARFNTPTEIVSGIWEAVGWAFRRKAA